MDIELWKPSLLQVYIWQIPVMMLNFSVIMFLSGLGISVWSAAMNMGLNWEGPEIKVSSASCCNVECVLITPNQDCGSLYRSGKFGSGKLLTLAVESVHYWTLKPGIRNIARL